MSQIAVSGTMRSSTASATSPWRVRVGSWAIANPAHEATTMVSGTARAATRNELAT